MNHISQFIGYDIHWAFWLAPGAAGLIAVFFFLSRLFGTRNAFYAVVTIGVGMLIQIIDRRGRQAGWNERIKKEKSDAERLVERAERARNDALAIEPGRLRDDDGFKRN